MALTPRVQAESIDLSSATIADIDDAFASDGMPFGVQFLGKPFTEPQLIAVASGYEAVSKHRAAPTAHAKTFELTTASVVANIH